MSKNILVTGGAGFIGSHLVDRLLSEGHYVRVFDNLAPQVHGSTRERGEWPAYCNQAADYWLGDVRNTDDLQKALKDIDIVFHFAAAVGVGQSMYEIQHYVDINATGTATLLNLIANNSKIRDRMQKIIVASSMSNYGEGEYECLIHGRVYPKQRTLTQLEQGNWELGCPVLDSQNHICGESLKPVPTRESKPLYTNSIYAITKKTQEEMCITIGEAYQIPAVALRFFNTYGTRQSLSNPYTGVAAIFSSRFINGNPPVIFEDGKQKRDFVHVSDLVQANLIVMNHQDAHGIYNVGSGKPISIYDVAKTIAHHLESPLSPEVIREYRLGDIRHCFSDNSKLKQLGYSPKVDFKIGIAELMQWVKQQSSEDSFNQMKDALTKRGLTI